MLTVKLLRESRDEVIQRLAIKNFDAQQLVDSVLSLDDQRRLIQVKLDGNLAEQNSHAKEIGILFKQGKTSEANALKQRVADLKEESKRLDQQMTSVEQQLNQTLVIIPNLPHLSVQKGTSAADNEVVRSGGAIPSLPGDAKPHWELAKIHGIIDFEIGVKLTGSGFPVYQGKGAKLQRALISFFLDENSTAGYLEVMPPLMVNEDSAYGTCQLPDKDGQMYHVQTDNFYLIPTAEVPVTNIYRNQIVEAKDLPIRLTAYTPCFRREAGSYGKDVRGLNRLHQFDKVEIVQIQHPDRSYDSLGEMVNHVEGLLKKLELPYRIMRLCGGDMSFASALTYDFEVFSAAQKMWLEVSSVSNFETFQSNRLMLRYRQEGEKRNQLVHTLNGSALALPRIVAALLENNQEGDTIRIPKVLQSYCGFDTI
ncbi:MAG TPA: serine--tRNA ligase [Tenuifilaceae bacterium]|jgi:seryl-tRNA synthetase|nr:serine--tRNA ligase [Bacteroidales bacterium]MDI9517545.1 serine--tRNA ligase [Bacteroidota bacterium]NLH57578.1 serine--tRNA ligase [Rikenellaceae bacterium]OQC64493.1 MAG: Serine--tRNA ligase [Bacteroidetes bacterium ADurb.Bin008]HOF90892.1 serine--tRNA ligase [Tenuifilaceae bacterium]